MTSPVSDLKGSQNIPFHQRPIATPFSQATRQSYQRPISYLQREDALRLDQALPVRLQPFEKQKMIRSIDKYRNLWNKSLRDHN